MTEIIGGREVIQRHLRHGDYWPDGRPTGEQEPDRIIVHAMGLQLDVKGERMYAATFLDRVVKLSAHLLVTPDGTPIRCRRDEEIAWHAKGHNDNSLGIEVLIPEVYNYDRFLRAIDEPWVRKKQLDTVIDAVRQWRSRWGIGADPGALDPHSGVDPDRKYDPGEGFPWDRFIERVAA